MGKQCPFEKWHQNSAPKGTILRTTKRYPKGTILVPLIFLSVRFLLTFFSESAVSPSLKKISGTKTAPLWHRLTVRKTGPLAASSNINSAGHSTPCMTAKHQWFWSWREDKCFHVPCRGKHLTQYEKTINHLIGISYFLSYSSYNNNIHILDILINPLSCIVVETWTS